MLGTVPLLGAQRGNAALIASIRPDVVVVSGDLTQRARPARNSADPAGPAGSSSPLMLRSLRPPVAGRP